MATQKQRQAARRDVKKAQAGARRKKTITRLPRKTRTALGREGAKAAARKRKLSPQVMDHYRGPFPTPESRVPIHVFPREILGSTPFLAETERELGPLTDRPALIVWANRDVAFRDDARARWEQLFPQHQTVILDGAGHYFQEDAPDEVVAAIRAWDAP